MLKLITLLKTNILSLGIIILLLFIPLYPKFPLFNVQGTYVALRLEDFLVAAIVGIWFIIQWRKKFPILGERVSRLILFYWAVGALALLSALLITKNIVPHIALLHYLRRIEYMSLFFVAFASVKKTKHVSRYFLAIFMATLVVIIYGFGQKYFSWPVVSTMNEEFSKGMLLQLTEWTRINSTFAGHYDLAAYIVLVISLTAVLIIWERKKWLKILIIFFGILAFYLLVLTASRISFVAYLLSISFILLFLRKGWFIPPVVALSILAMFFSGDLGERFIVMVEPAMRNLREIRIFKVEAPREKIALKPTTTPTPSIKPVVIKEPVGEVEQEIVPTSKTATSPAEATPAAWPAPEKAAVAAQRSTDIRFKMEWPRAMRAFLKNPILGTGYSSVTLATDNDYLRALAETGLLGFFAFAFIFLEIIRRVVIFLQKRPFGFEKAVVIGITGGSFGFFANALFIDVFEASKLAFIFWILIGILVGTINLSEKSIQTS
jgi:hypothetical protein